MKSQIIKVVTYLIVGGLFAGCAANDPHKRITNIKYSYSINMNHYTPTGENQIFINEFIDNKKTRLVKKLVILDKDIPAKVKFNSCKSLKSIPVIEYTKDGYIEHESVDGKTKYLLSDCISEVDLIRDSTGLYVKGEIKVIKYLQFSKTNLKSFMPAILTTNLKKQNALF